MGKVVKKAGKMVIHKKIKLFHVKRMHAAKKIAKKAIKHAKRMIKITITKHILMIKHAIKAHKPAAVIKKMKLKFKTAKKAAKLVVKKAKAKAKKFHKKLLKL